MADFQAIADALIETMPDLAPCRPTVEKELLHLEMLRAMHEAGHLAELMFKGGTCLRLCHGALRLSEDLDFSGGPSFDQRLFDDLEDALRARIGHRFGLDVTVSSPKLAGQGTRTANRWMARIVTRPEPRPRLRVQRIKIEVDREPISPKAQTLPVAGWHQSLRGTYVPVPVRTAPLREVSNDKAIALPMSILERENPRFRDIWDLAWLAERPRNAAPDATAVVAALTASGTTERYRDALRVTAERLPGIVESGPCRDALGRFLPRSVALETLEDRDYRRYLATKVIELLEPVRERIEASGALRRPPAA